MGSKWNTCKCTCGLGYMSRNSLFISYSLHNVLPLSVETSTTFRKRTFFYYPEHGRIVSILSLSENNLTNQINALNLDIAHLIVRFSHSSTAFQCKCVNHITLLYNCVSLSGCVQLTFAGNYSLPKIQYYENHKKSTSG